MAIKKNRITPQDIEDVIANGYPLAQIAREAGVDRISLSKFRNHGQALKAADQAALIAWLQENDLWDDGDQEPATAQQKSAGDNTSQAHVLPRPMIAITIGEELDPEDSERLAARADEVVKEIQRITAAELVYDDMLIFKDDEPNDDSKNEHQQLTGLLAEFAILQFRMQGNDLAPPLATDNARPTTHAEWLAREFPWPDGATDPDTDADDAAQGLAAGTAPKASERGQSKRTGAKETVFG